MGKLRVMFLAYLIFVTNCEQQSQKYVPSTVSSLPMRQTITPTVTQAETKGTAVHLQESEATLTSTQSPLPTTPAVTQTSYVLPASTALPTPIPTLTPRPPLRLTATPTPVAFALTPYHSFPALPNSHPTIDVGDRIAGQWAFSEGIRVEYESKFVLQIDRDGESYEVDFRELELYGEYLTFPEIFDTTSFRIIDLNNDAEPEIILQWTFYVSVSSTVLYFDEDNTRYRNTIFVHNELTPRDLNEDGIAEFYMVDEQFNMEGLWGSRAVRVVSPVRILRFSEGELANVSAEFPIIVESNAAHWFAQTVKFEGCDIWGWGTYLADMHTLGRAEEAWQIYADHCSGEEYYRGQRDRILEALENYGYVERLTLGHE